MNERDLRYLWNVRPSAEEGYSRCYFTETAEGDRIEVDFNFGRAMARVTLTLNREFGRQYVAVVKSGTILQERDITSRQPVDLTSRIAPLGPLFGAIPDEALLRSLGGNYGLPRQPSFTVPRSRRYGSGDLLPLDRLNVFALIRRYLQKKRNIEALPAPFYARWLRRLPDEILDLSLGCGLYFAYTLGFLQLGQFAVATGFLGLFTGAIDWVWRQRAPFLPKVAILLAASVAAVYYQVQYRIWGIFL